MNSPLLPLFISYRSSWEKLIEYQANSSCVIMSVILMTTLLYKLIEIVTLHPFVGIIRHLWKGSLRSCLAYISIMSFMGRRVWYIYLQDHRQKNQNFKSSLWLVQTRHSTSDTQSCSDWLNTRFRRPVLLWTLLKKVL